MNMNNLQTRVDQMERDIKVIKAALGIFDNAPIEPAKTSVVKSVQMEQAVTEILREIGVPAAVKGFRYLREAIIIAINDMDVLDAVTKVLYPQVAKTFQTTPAIVERAIRHAIEVAHKRWDLDVKRKYFGNSIRTSTGRPTSSEFIAAVADCIRMKGGNNAVD